MLPIPVFLSSWISSTAALSHSLSNLVEFQIYVLKKAYENALCWIPRGKNWTWCCKQALKLLHDNGKLRIEGERTICNWNIAFRREYLFLNPSRRGARGIEFFNIFPEAHVDLYRWGKANLKELSVDKARNHLLEVIIPKYHARCNEEIKQMGEKEITQPEFLAMCKLKTLCHNTAWRWMRYVGFDWKDNTKSYYTDGHEKPENVKD